MAGPGIKTQSLTMYEENVLLHAKIQFILTGNDSYNEKIGKLMQLGLSDLCALTLVQLSYIHSNANVYPG